MQGVVSLLAQGLSRAGLDVHVAAGGDLSMPPILETAMTELPDRVTFHRLPDPSRSAGMIRWLRSLGQVVGDVSPDVLHGHGLRTALPLVAVGRRMPRRILVTCHGIPPSDLPRTARLVRASGVTVGAVGPGLAQDLRTRGLRPIILPNGMAPAPDPIDREVFMSSYGLDPTLPLVVVPGRLSPQKDPITMLDATEHFDAPLAFVGDGPLRGMLEDEIERRRLEDRVIVTGWRDDARAIIGSADLLAMSSIWEGQPLVMIEAGMAGIPITTTAARGVTGWLVNQRDALIVPVGDSLALGTAISRALSDASLRTALIAGSTALGKTHSIDAMIDAHLTAYAMLSASREP